MQICISPQTDNHASIPPLSFYRPDALPATHQQRQSTEGSKYVSSYYGCAFSAVTLLVGHQEEAVTQ